MGKVGSALKMMMMLQSRGKMKIKEIASELEISERQVQEYRNELEQAGVFINSQSGKYGGYSLGGNYRLSLPITSMDMSILDNVSEYLELSNNMYSKEYKSILDKIASKCNVKHTDDMGVDYFHIQSRGSISPEEERKRCFKISDAYITKRKLVIKYRSVNSDMTERTVHPYGLYTYNGDTYMVAFCEYRNEMRDFKICRIIDMDVTDEKYEIDKKFDFSTYTKNSIGNYKGDEYDVHIIVKEPFATIVRERIITENQIITELENGSIDFRARIKGYPQIKSWILGMGSCVKVIEPEILKKEIIEEIDILKNEYSK